MQLVAYGAQDIYLTGNPSITFFKLVYRRHTQFALESIEQTFNGAVDFGKRISATISRNGDLITTMFLEITMTKGTSAYASWYPAEQLVQEIELEIGGQRIDKLYSDWYRIYDELFRNATEKQAYKRLVDFDYFPAKTDAAYAAYTKGDEWNFELMDPANDADYVKANQNTPDWEAGTSRRFYLPIQFFFNQNVGLALPLIALQYHEVKLNFVFADKQTMGAAGIDTSVSPTATLYVTYVFLDTDERRRFAQTSHEYLIQQLQFTGAETVTVSANKISTTNVRLNLNHPVKYLAFALKGSRHGQFTTGPRDTLSDKFAPLSSAKLQLNGNDRFSERKGSYFNIVQPYEHLKTVPHAGVYLYSFCLNPAEHQPSGTCNFSRIDNATLIVSTKQASIPPTTTNVVTISGITVKDSANVTVQAMDEARSAANIKDESSTLTTATNLNNLLVYGVNYNVLRIMSGMGGLAYSN